MVLTQNQAIKNLMVAESKWRTLEEIEWATGFPPASISAQLRHLRKAPYGGHVLEKRMRLGTDVYEYRVSPKGSIAEYPYNAGRSKLRLMIDSLRDHADMTKEMWSDILLILKG